MNRREAVFLFTFEVMNDGLKGHRFLWILFIFYWITVVWLTFFSGPTADRIKKSSYGQSFFPPVYKMYTSPPKQIIQSEYIYYKNGKIIQKIKVDSLFQLQMKKNFTLPEFKKDLKQYLAVFYAPNVDLGNATYRYALDSAAQKEFPIAEYLFCGSNTKQIVENQLNFGIHLQKVLRETESADSMVLVIRRDLNKVAMDKEQVNHLASFITEKEIYRKGIYLKNE